MKRWLTLILLVLVSLAFVVVPVILIQPFRPQTARALEVGYWLRRFAPWATLKLVGFAAIEKSLFDVLVLALALLGPCLLRQQGSPPHFPA